MLLPPRSREVRTLADCDSFFASCEVARRPEWRGKPVCVGKDIVLAATYEAKRQGIRTGTPFREAQPMLRGQGIFVSPDFGYYGRMSKRLFGCLAEWGDTLLPFSIDEGFLRLPSFGESDSASYHLYVQHVQQQLYQQTGIPVTFGVAPTKLLAKTFAKLGKPRGVYVALSDAEIMATLERLPLTATPFIGDRFARHLPHCLTVADFAALPGTEIRRVYGRSGLKLWLEVNAIPALTMRRKGHQTTISRRRSFHPRFTRDKELLLHYLMANFEKAYAHLLREEVKLRRLYVYLKTKWFEKRKAVHRFPMQTDERKLLVETVKELFERVYRSDELYRTTWVGFGELLPRGMQGQLLEPALDDRLVAQRRISHLIDRLNTKRGCKMIATAATQQTISTQKDYAIWGTVT